MLVLRNELLNDTLNFFAAIVILYTVYTGALLALTVGANCPGLAATNPGLQKLLFGAIGLPFGLFFVLVSFECNACIHMSICCVRM
jgi:hypothetical protein